MQKSFMQEYKWCAVKPCIMYSLPFEERKKERIKNYCNRFSYSFQLHIFLLQALESFLGDTELWPASILNHLFIDAPTAEIVKKVSAFFMAITSLSL